MGLSRCRPTVAEIDPGACSHNLRELRRGAPGKALWPVVKADAYGHGAVTVARALSKEAVAGFCVATASEGRELRQAGVGQPILVMVPPVAGGHEDPFRLIVQYGLSCSLENEQTLQGLTEASRALGIGPVSTHLKLDTGMGRLGVMPDRAVDLACAVDDEPALSLDGIFSNLATADSDGGDPAAMDMVQQQAQVFRDVVHELSAAGLTPTHRTLANSAGLMSHPCTWKPDEFTGARPGIAVYGAVSSGGGEGLRLRPAMRLVTRIATIRSLPEGAAVGYGTAVRTHRPTRLAVLPVGYHDGWPRSLDDRARVLLRGRRVPVIGRVSMDITLVDVTDISSAAAGDEVVLFGRGRGRETDDESEAPASGYAATLAISLAAVDAQDAPPSDEHRAVDRREVRVEDVADWAGTIPHEILSRVGGRVPRQVASAAAPAGSRETSGR